MKDTSVTARIKCEVEVPVGNWNRSATFNELSDKVRREGIEILCKILKDHGGRVVGIPCVLFTMVEEDR